jgi:L-glyceraldehyde 3-phosphate reductase
LYLHPLLRKKYLNGVPNDSRAVQGKGFDRGKLNPELIQALNQLNDIASRRGQTLAQMALAWVLRGGRVTSALMGASKPEQVLDCVGAIENLDFTDDELSEIDHLSSDQGINLWAASSETQSFGF